MRFIEVYPLPVGINIIGSVLAKITSDGTAMLGSVKVGAIPVGTNIIGSVAADIQKFGVALPAGTSLIGSVVADVVQVRNALGSVEVSNIGKVLGTREKWIQ